MFIWSFILLIFLMFGIAEASSSFFLGSFVDGDALVYYYGILGNGTKILTAIKGGIR